MVMQPAELTKQACAVPVTLTDPSPLTPNCCVQSSYNTSLQVSLTKRLRWNMLRKDAELKSNLQRTFSGSILQHQIKKYRESSCCHRFTFVCSQVLPGITRTTTEPLQPWRNNAHCRLPVSVLFSTS